MGLEQAASTTERARTSLVAVTACVLLGNGLFLTAQYAD
jgi:hypothetical protein